MVDQTRARSIAGIRVGTVVDRGISTECPCSEVGMSAGPAVTHVVGTVVTIIRAQRAVGLVIAQTDSRSITAVRVGAIVVR